MIHRFRSFLVSSTLSLLLFVLCPSISSAQWVNGQAAEFVVGQTDFVSRLNGVSSTLLGSLGSHVVAIDWAHGKMYFSDPINHRVLRYPYPVNADNVAADLAIGQTDLNSNVAPTYPTASNLNRPWGAAVYNGDLWVVDRADGRLLRYPHAWSDVTSGPAADLVLGAPDFTTVATGTSDSLLLQPRGMCFDASGNLWVADGNNNRVLEFANANSKTNGARADKVLGQANFTSALAPAPPTSSSMALPYGICFEGTTLWVADGTNNRVLRFLNAASKANGAAADGVLGQADFVTSTMNPNPNAATMYTPTSVDVDATGTLYLCDYGNNRVLIYKNASSKANGANADNVLGQPNFSANTAGTTASLLGYANGVTVDNANSKLLVCDEYNYRVLQFSASSPLPIQLASFFATTSGNGITLQWKTLSEVNDYGFDIQRSNSSAFTQWSKVGFVAGHGTTTAVNTYSFIDAATAVPVYYRLKQIDLNGSYHLSEPVAVGSVTGVTSQRSIPQDFSLAQNYPNPFNPSTQIDYALPKAGVVSLIIFDVLGREVATLSNGYQEAGAYTARWDAGTRASGVYFAHLRVGSSDGSTLYAKNIKLLLTK